jgi:hypothetical protein
VQDTVDALEYVRQLFANGCIQSGFFHRFACTVHSPVGRTPRNTASRCCRCRRSLSPRTTSASSTPPASTTTRLGVGLKKALYNYMHGIGLDDLPT